MPTTRRGSIRFKAFSGPTTVPTWTPSTNSRSLLSTVRSDISRKAIPSRSVFEPRRRRTRATACGSTAVQSRATRLVRSFRTRWSRRRCSMRSARTAELLDREVEWLSRGLAEACLAFINETEEGEGLRVCAYEFTYRPFAEALKRALERGVDVCLVYHDSNKTQDARDLIAEVGFPDEIVFKRTRTAIPHNKFIVKIERRKGHGGVDGLNQLHRYRLLRPNQRRPCRRGRYGCRRLSGILGKPQGRSDQERRSRVHRRELPESAERRTGKPHGDGLLRRA